MNNVKITGIMACDPHGVIALNNRLPWHYPEEIQFFRKTVLKQTVILGYKTFLELQEDFFKNHFSIVFSKKHHGARLNNVTFVSDIKEFKKVALPKDKACFMIGGAIIARLFLKENLLNDFLLTIVDKEYNGDTFFPLELINAWPRTLLKKNKDFSIYHYSNPQGKL